MMAWRPNVNPDAQRFSELAAELVRRQQNQPPEKQIQVAGDRFIIPVSPCQNESKIIDRVALYKRLRRLGIEELAQIYTITLTNARKILSPKELPKFIATERTGPRTIGEPVLKEFVQ